MDLSSIFKTARSASRSLNLLEQSKIDDVILKLADLAELKVDYILAENAKDLASMEKSNPLYDRLLLTKERIQGIASDLRNVASLHSPVGEILSETVRENGMQITKVRVPFGVIGIIYEARPNVSFDVFALCFKSANVSLLKGGTDAKYSNQAIVGLIRELLESEGLDPNYVTLLPSEREATAELLNAVGYVDLLIPRGSSSLINYVRDNSRVPVIETGAGICHTYIDKDADIKKASDIVFNAKTRRVSVCNALDCMVIHKDKLVDIVAICERLAEKNVVIYADDRAYEALKLGYPSQLLLQADASSFGTEFLDYKMSIKTVDSLTDAVDHVSEFTSHHSEAIITECAKAAQAYSKMVDAACVYTNVSTAFTDGAQFGFGAEIGISTQKLHARGPMALREITSYKYLITGDGQIRS
ncbi:MAG: glutamate-5-semialdehyde dehydrogenase [Rikenellaceae bacterium]